MTNSIEELRSKAYKLVKVNSDIISNDSSIKEKMRSKEIAISELHKIQNQLAGMKNSISSTLDEKDMQELSDLIDEINRFILEIQEGKKVSTPTCKVPAMPVGKKVVDSNDPSKRPSMISDLDAIDSMVDNIKLIQKRMDDGIIDVPINSRVRSHLINLVTEIEVSLVMYKFKYIDYLTTEQYNEFCKKEEEIVSWAYKKSLELGNRRNI